MLRLARMTDYCVVVLSYLARHRDGVQTAQSIAADTGLPLASVAKVLKGLAHDDKHPPLVAARRGAAGGYALARDPEAITVGDMIAALEGRRVLVDCVDGSDSACAMEGSCPMRGRWNPVNAAVGAALESVTLADMVAAERQGRTAGRAPAAAERHDAVA